MAAPRQAVAPAMPTLHKCSGEAWRLAFACCEARYGVSQTQIAKACGTRQQHVSEWGSGQAQPRLDHLDRLRAHFPAIWLDVMRAYCAPLTLEDPLDAPDCELTQLSEATRESHEAQQALLDLIRTRSPGQRASVAQEAQEASDAWSRVAAAARRAAG